MAQEIHLRPRYSDADSPQKLDDSILDAIQEIERLDLEVPREAAIQAGHLTSAEAPSVERELRRFLALCLLARRGVIDEAGIGPTKPVDKLWHSFVLWTKEYVDFCERALGGYLHHEYGLTPPPEDDGSRMREALETYFERVDEEVWAGSLDRCWPNGD